MSRRQKNPLRLLTEAERRQLEHLACAHTAPAAEAARAKVLLAVAGGHGYTQAARLAGRCSGQHPPLPRPGHGVAGSRRTGLECGPHALPVGRQARGAPPTRPCAEPSRGRFGRAGPPTTPALARGRQWL